MRTAVIQYAHLAAIIMLVVAPAWAFSPLVGLPLALVSITAWAILSPITEFDKLLGEFLIYSWQAVAKIGRPA